MAVKHLATNFFDYFTRGTGVEILLQQPQGEVDDIPIVMSAMAATEFQFRLDTFENLPIARWEEVFIGGRLFSKNHRFRIRHHTEARQAGDEVAGSITSDVR